MSSQTSSFTDSALSDKVKEFLTRFKDKKAITSMLMQLMQ